MNKKRDLLSFGGTHPTVINLEHLSYMHRDKENANRLVLVFSNTPLWIDFPDEESVKSSFEKILTAWVGDVVETEQKDQ